MLTSSGSAEIIGAGAIVITVNLRMRTLSINTIVHSTAVIIIAINGSMSTTCSGHAQVNGTSIVVIA